MKSPLKHFQRRLAEIPADAYLATNDTDIRYLTGFPASESWLLVFPDKVFYITDSRYLLEARQGLKGVTVKLYKGSIIQTLFELCRKRRASRLAFDGRHLSFAQYQAVRKQAPKGTRLVARQGMVEELRMIKTKDEVEQTRRCLRLHHQALKYLKTVIRPGKTEREVFLALERYVKTRGADFSFDPIIASGPNSCFPHARVTGRKLRSNEPVLVDFGVDIGGYKSDLTRIFFLGKIPPSVTEAYHAVEEAQKRAIAAIRPGVPAKDVDSAARDFLKTKKLDRFFGHSLGHGVGLDIHESPRISSKSTVRLKTNMMFTVEPGVYLPDRFGIRIEDMVLVTERGCEVLSK